MSSVLKNLIASAGESAIALHDELQQDGSLHIDHDRALRSEAEELLRVALLLFSRLSQSVEERQIRQSGGPEIDKNKLVEWHNLFVSVEELFQSVADILRSIDELKLTPEDKRQFMDAWRELRGIVAIDPARVAVSVRQFETGHFRILGDAQA